MRLTRRGYTGGGIGSSLHSEYKGVRIMLIHRKDGITRHDCREGSGLEFREMSYMLGY